MLSPLVFTAVHHGPYETLSPVQARASAGTPTIFVAEGAAKTIRQRQGLAYLDLASIEAEFGGLEAWLRQIGAAALIHGTSEGAAEPDPERLLAAAAGRVGLPVFAIEDFPGNYHAQPGARLDGLFVEYPETKQLHLERGIDASRIHLAANPRAESLAALDPALQRRAVRARLGLKQERVVLWVGQPDERNSHETLARLLPALQALDCAVWFRAHPRDAWYQTGRYRQALEHEFIRDVSGEDDVPALCCASDLLLTQCSSVGVEALWLGVPAVFVLFEDLGKRFLRAHKGYDIPPWCADGCAFVIERREEIAHVLQRALWDDVERRAVCERFARGRPSGVSGSEEILRIIEQALIPAC